MNRKTKALGAALGAILVLGALYAPVAPAQQGHLDMGVTTTLVGEETGEQQNRLTAFGAAVECPGSTYTGHKLEATPHQSELDGETAATITPFYRETDEEGAPNCTVPTLNWSATVDMNGCDYAVQLGEATEEGTYPATFDVVCPGEEEITVTLWTTEESHTEEPSEPACVLHIAAQEGLEGAHATDTGDGHIALAGEVTGLEVQRTEQEHSAPVLCPTGTTHNAKLDLDVTISNHLTAVVGISS